MVERPLRPGEHDRSGIVKGQRGQQRDLLHGVRAVRDDHPVGAVVER
jgi:hypothetical protein